jgi:hypothetical protein
MLAACGTAGGGVLEQHGEHGGQAQRGRRGHIRASRPHSRFAAGFALRGRPEPRQGRHVSSPGRKPRVGKA